MSRETETFSPFPAVLPSADTTFCRNAVSECGVDRK